MHSPELHVNSLEAHELVAADSKHVSVYSSRICDFHWPPNKKNNETRSLKQVQEPIQLQIIVHHHAKLVLLSVICELLTCCCGSHT